MDGIMSLNNSMGGMWKKPVTSELILYKNSLSDPAAQEFLKNKKNLTEETIKHFFLGYDLYRNNITIPDIKNGEVVNLAFRSLEEKTKDRYQKMKGCENWIFNEIGLDKAKKMGGLLITSNQFDCMSAWQVGVENVVSVPVGKLATGEWMDLFDSIPKIYISFENTKKGKKLALEFADRLGVDKCYEVELPEDIIDLNSFFRIKTKDDFKDLIKKAKPFYKYTYQDLNSILDDIMDKGDSRISIDLIPLTKIDVDYLFMISGLPGVGKTTYVMNIANRLVDVDIPTLVVPYERGPRAVGQKFLGVRFEKTEDEIMSLDPEAAKEMRSKIDDIPIYFATPDIEKMRHTIERAKKIFGVRAIIVDHLEYNVSTSNKSGEVDKMKIVMTEWKNICIDLGVMFFVVHHVRKGQQGTIKRDLTMEDMVGGGTPQRVAEAVIMLSTPEPGQIKVSVVKNNHGQKGFKIFEFTEDTGKIGEDITEEAKLTPAQKALADF